MPQNTVLEFPASGHYFFLEQPEQEQAVEAIRSFVARLAEDDADGAFMRNPKTNRDIDQSISLTSDRTTQSEPRGAA